MPGMIAEAISPGGTRDFPAVIPYESLYIRDHWEALTHLPWWYTRSPDLTHQMAWRSEVFAAIGQDWMALPFCNSRDHRARRAIVTQGEAVFLRDLTTGDQTRLTRPAVSGWDQFEGRYSGHVERPPHSTEEIDEVLFPAPPIHCAVVQSAGHADLANQALAAFPALYPLWAVTSPLWGCFNLWGYEDLMVTIAQRPDLIAYACRRLLLNEIENARLGAALGARGVWVEECLTDQVHPRDYRALCLPYLQALIEEIHGLGMQAILYYCGNPNDRLDLLLASGADALALEESKKGFTIDLNDLAETIDGRCALLGNLDAVHLLRSGGETALRAAIERQRAAGARNHHRFVFSLGSPVTPETSAERVRQYISITREA